MKLRYMTCTGCDDHTNLDQMLTLQKEFPFLEFGILVHSSKLGLGRYPSERWLQSLLARRNEFTHLAMHVCGEKTLDFVFKPNKAYSYFAMIAKEFPRIQLNLPAGYFDRLDINEFIGFFSNLHPHQEIITQHNKAHENLHIVVGEPNHAVLFDSSGGRGITRQSWPTPLPKKENRCGFAGGLSPENLEKELPLLQAAAGDQEFWIDMETGVRTNDRFDLSKVRRCAEIVRRCYGEEESGLG